MQNALIIGDSGGIGRALRAALEARLGPEKVTGLSRSADGLDVRDEASIAAALDPLEGPYDLVFCATGALEIDGHSPEKALKDLSAEGLRDQFETNAMGPALVLKHAFRLMPRDRRAVFAALSARVGSIGDNRLGGWYSYRASKSALNQILHGAAVEIGRTHKQAICVVLHPGTVATPFTEKYLGRHPAVAPDEAAGNLLSVIDGLTPAQSGGFFDYAGKEIAW